MKRTRIAALSLSASALIGLAVHEGYRDEAYIPVKGDVPTIGFGDTLAASARETRNEMLTASDWTQVADAPVDQAAWAAYRQALRDITDQPGFPHDITWPQEP